MEIPFNYKDVKFFLLPLFLSLIILSITGKIEPKIIDSNIVMYYSIFGFIMCIISWNVDEQIQNRAKRIREDTGLYFPEMDDIRIHEMLSKKDDNRNYLVIFLFFGLIVPIFLNIPMFLFTVYSIIGIFYLIILYQFVLVDESF